MLKQQIAHKLEIAFSHLGFAEPSVAQLKQECGVSLRTLYKYYPSKESMVIAALEHRHQSYIEFLKDNAPEYGSEAATHVFNKLGDWMANKAPNGCLSVSAIAAFPSNQPIVEAVQQHKLEVRALLATLCQRDDLATDLFILHEGVCGSWPVLGRAAVESATKQSANLLKREN